MCTHRRGIPSVPVAVEPVAAPAPAPATLAPVQTADAAIAIGVAVDRSPEEDVACTTLFVHFPCFWYLVCVLEQVIEHVRRVDGLTSKFSGERFSADDLAPLLLW